MSIHLAADPDGYTTAIERHLPFYRTVCGGVKSMNLITLEPVAVSCPVCRRLIQRAMKQQAPAPSGSGVPMPSGTESFEVQFDEDEDATLSFDEEPDLSDFADFSNDVPSTDDGDAEPSESSEQDMGGMMAMAQSMVEPLVSQVELSEAWERWTTSPEDEDDIRYLVSDEERELLIGLHNLSSMIGLHDLSARVLSIVDRLAEGCFDSTGEEE